MSLLGNRLSVFFIDLVGKWAEFIIIFRFMRLVNGMILSAKQAADKRVHEQKKKVQQLEKELADLKKQYEIQDTQ